MFAEVVRHVLCRRRVEAARAWSEAARQDAAERSAAVRRILAQDVPDPAGRQGAR